VLHDLAVRDAHDLEAGDDERLARGRPAEQRAGVGAADGHSLPALIAVVDAFLDGERDVGRHGAKVTDRPLDVLSGPGAMRLRAELVLDEVLGHHLVDDVGVASLEPFLEQSGQQVVGFVHGGHPGVSSDWIQ
jgi:hypothetical protein